MQNDKINFIFPGMLLFSCPVAWKQQTWREKKGREKKMQPKLLQWITFQYYVNENWPTLQGFPPFIALFGFLHIQITDASLLIKFNNPK